MEARTDPQEAAASSKAPPKAKAAAVAAPLAKDSTNFMANICVISKSEDVNHETIVQTVLRSTSHLVILLCESPASELASVLGDCFAMFKPDEDELLSDRFVLSLGPGAWIIWNNHFIDSVVMTTSYSEEGPDGDEFLLYTCEATLSARGMQSVKKPQSRLPLLVAHWPPDASEAPNAILKTLAYEIHKGCGTVAGIFGRTHEGLIEVFQELNAPTGNALAQSRA